MMIKEERYGIGYIGEAAWRAINVHLKIKGGYLLREVSIALALNSDAQ